MAITNDLKTIYHFHTGLVYHRSSMVFFISALYGLPDFVISIPMQHPLTAGHLKEFMYSTKAKIYCKYTFLCVLCIHKYIVSLVCDELEAIDSIETVDDV